MIFNRRSPVWKFSVVMVQDGGRCNYLLGLEEYRLLRAKRVAHGKSSECCLPFVQRLAGGLPSLPRIREALYFGPVRMTENGAFQAVRLGSACG